MMNKLIRKRLHPLWIAFEILNTLREIIVPAVIFFLINLSSESIWVKFGLIAIIIYLIYKIIVTFFEWKNYTYLLASDHIEIVEGRFITKKRYISFNRIQGYEQHTSFFHRLFRLTAVIIKTGSSGEDAVVKLEMIGKHEAEKIVHILKQYENMNTSTEISSTDEPNINKHYEISWKEIVLISISSLYFLAVIPVILSFYSKIAEFFTMNEWLLNIYEELRQSFFHIIVTSIILLIILIIAGILLTYIRLGKYIVSSDHHNIYISKGILNTTNYTIPRNKINGLVIKKAFPRRLFHIVRVELVSLGDSFSEENVDTDTLFPFISEKRLKNLLNEVIPEYRIAENLHSLPKEAYFVNLIQPSYSLVIVTFFVFFFWPEYWFIPLAFFLWLVFYRILKTKLTKFYRDEEQILLQSGVMTTEIFITNCERIDEFTIEQSWLERILHLATLDVSIRAKPIYSMKVEHLQLEDANDCLEWYQNKIIENSKRMTE